MSSKEYREFADECLHWAKTARSDREKRIFLQMAETWMLSSRSRGSSRTAESHGKQTTEFWKFRRGAIPRVEPRGEKRCSGMGVIYVPAIWRTSAARGVNGRRDHRSTSAQ